MNRVFSNIYRKSSSLRNAANTSLGKVEPPKTASTTTAAPSSPSASSATKVKPNSVIRGNAVALLTGAVIFGSSYYYLKGLIEEETNELISKTKSIESLKTKRQLLEEEKREQELEHEQLLKKREKAAQLPEERDQALHKQLLLKFYRNWNSIFYGVSSEIDSQNQKKQEERMNKMRSRIEDEVQARYGVREGEYKIKSVHEE